MLTSACEHTRSALLRRDVARVFAEPLDPLLDLFERFETGPDGGIRNFLQHIDRNRVAQAVEIVDQLTAGAGQEQPVGPAVFWVRPSLQEAVLDQAVEQADQRDRLQLKDVRQVDLRQSFLLPQSEQYDPLRAGGAAALGAVIDVVAQQARTFDQLRDQLTFQVERHIRVSPSGRVGPSKLSKCSCFSSYSVFTH